MSPPLTMTVALAALVLLLAGCYQCGCTTEAAVWTQPGLFQQLGGAPALEGAPFNATVKGGPGPIWLDSVEWDAPGPGGSLHIVQAKASGMVKITMIDGNRSEVESVAGMFYDEAAAGGVPRDDFIHNLMGSVAPDAIEGTFEAFMGPLQVEDTFKGFGGPNLPVADDTDYTEPGTVTVYTDREWIFSFRLPIWEHAGPSEGNNERITVDAWDRVRHTGDYGEGTQQEYAKRIESRWAELGLPDPALTDARYSGICC